MKKIFSVFLMIIAVQFAFGQVDFKDYSMQKAQEVAEEEGKLIFVDLATDWCGWCKKMDRDTFQKSKVGDYVNENYVSLHLNGEKGEGIELAKKYDVRGYPTLLFFNAKGELVSKNVGYHKAADFLYVVEEIREANE